MRKKVSQARDQTFYALEMERPTLHSYKGALKPNLDKWMNQTHDQLNFHLIQVQRLWLFQ